MHCSDRRFYLPCSSLVAHTRMSTQTALVCTFSLKRFIRKVSGSLSFSSFSLSSYSRDWRSFCPFWNSCLVNSWISFTRDVGRSTTKLCRKVGWKIGNRGIFARLMKIRNNGSFYLFSHEAALSSRMS